MRSFECIIHSRFSRVNKPAVLFIPYKTENQSVKVKYVIEIFIIPCKKVVRLVNIKSRKGGGIMEGLDITLADNSTNGNISTLQN